MIVLQILISLLIIPASIDGQQTVPVAGTQSAPTPDPSTNPAPAPVPTPDPTPAINQQPITPPAPTTAIIFTPTAPGTGPTDTPGPAPEPNVVAPYIPPPDPAAPAMEPQTDYPVSRCGPIYTNEWCPAGPQGQSLYCSRWGYCGEGNKADEYAGMFVDINTPCTTLADSECKAKNPSYFCFVPEMRCAVKITHHDDVKQSSQQKSGAVATSISAIAVIFLAAVRFVHF